MAHFPKAFNASTTPANVHDIHKAAGALSGTDGFWASGGDGIDIYKFAAATGGGNVAYAVIIMKNTGAAGSFVTLSSGTPIDITVANGDSPSDYGFSLVSSLAHTVVNGTQLLVTQATLEGNAAFTGVGNDATHHGDVDPLGYLPISVATDTTLEHDASDDDPDDILASATALNTGNKYIPIYAPSAVGSKALDVDASATPHYCAVMVKFYQANTSQVTTLADEVFLNINVEGGTSANILLIGTTQNSGALEIQDGTIDSATQYGVFTSRATFGAAETGGLIEVEGDTAITSIDLSANVNTSANKIMVCRYPKSFFHGSEVYYHLIRVYSSIESAPLYSAGDGNLFMRENVDNSLSNLAGQYHFMSGSYAPVLNGSANYYDYNAIIGDISTSAIDISTFVFNTGSEFGGAESENWYSLKIEGADAIEGSAVWVHPNEDLSDTYFTSLFQVGNDTKRMAGQSPQNSFLWVGGVDYTKMNPASMGTEEEIAANPIFTSAILIDWSNYRPWNFSGEAYAKFNNDTFSGANAPVIKSEFQKKLLYDGAATTQVTSEAQIYSSSVVNKYSAADDAGPTTFIQPANDSAGCMIRDAQLRVGTEVANASQSYTFNIETSFTNQSITPNTSYSSISDVSDFYCGKIKFGSNNEMEDAAGNNTGKFAIDGNGFTRVSAHNDAAANGDNLETNGGASTILSSATGMTTVDGNGNMAPGSVQRKIWFKFLFSPFAKVSYGWGDLTHDASSASSTPATSGMDCFGRVLKTSRFIMKGGYNALFDKMGADVNAWIDSTYTDWPEIRMSGMYWPDDPTLLAVTQGSPANFVGTIDSGSNAWEKMSVTIVSDAADATGNLNMWFPADIDASADAATNSSNVSTSVDITSSVSSSASATTASRTNMLQKKFNGAEMVRSYGAFRKASDGAATYEIAPCHSIAKLPISGAGGNKIRITKPWNWFIEDHLRLNAVLGKYECYIPINLASIGDAPINILDISLVESVGSGPNHVGSGSTTYEELPAGNSTKSKIMAPWKPFKSHTLYNSKVTGVYTNVDIIAQTGSLDPTAGGSDHFHWGLYGLPSTAITGENYTDDISSVGQQNLWLYGNNTSYPTHNNISFANNEVTDPEGSTFDNRSASISGTGPYASTSGGYNGGDLLGNVWPADRQAGRLVPGESENMSTPSSTMFSQITSGGSRLPYVHFCVQQSAVTGNGITEAYFYNRVRVRYCREVKADVIEPNVNGGPAAGAPVVKDTQDLPVYEAYIQIKLSLTTVIGVLEVSDLESDTVSVDGSGVIDFGTIQV